MIVNKYQVGGGGSGTQGKQGPQGYQGPEGPQGAEGKQGPAGGGEGGDCTILNSVSALPMNQTWVEYQDSTFYKVREDIVNDGEYMLHFNGTYTSVNCANGAITGSSRNMTYNSTDGKWHHDLYNDLVAWDDNGKLYWDCPWVVSMLDAYGNGDNKEGLSETAAANESSVAALQGEQGVYQVVNNQWEHVGIQGPQGPAGGGQGGDSTILNPVSGLPSDYSYGTWEEWADDTYRIVRETTNAGDYLIHWDSNNHYTGCHVSSDGSIDYSGYGMQQGADGRWYYDGNGNSITAYTAGGKIYFICTAIISMFDAYGTGVGDKEGNTSAVFGPTDAAGSVRATSGGTYQALDNNWVPLVHSESGVMNIWKGTAAEYGALVSYDNNTLYIIL